MEGMNKIDGKASMYVTIMDMASKKVLFTKRMIGKVMGFGFRNYWASSIYQVLKQIDKKDYSNWRAEAK